MRVGAGERGSGGPDTHHPWTHHQHPVTLYVSTWKGFLKALLHIKPDHLEFIVLWLLIRVSSYRLQHVMHLAQHDEHKQVIQGLEICPCTSLSFSLPILHQHALLYMGCSLIHTALYLPMQSSSMLMVPCPVTKYCLHYRLHSTPFYAPREPSVDDIPPRMEFLDKNALEL